MHGVVRSQPRNATRDVKWHQLDLLDPQARARLIEEVQPDTIVHVAWNVEHGTFWTTPENLDWVGASLDMLRRAAETGRARFAGPGSFTHLTLPTRFRVRAPAS